MTGEGQRGQSGLVAHASMRHGGVGGGIEQDRPRGDRESILQIMSWIGYIYVSQSQVDYRQALQVSRGVLPRGSHLHTPRNHFQQVPSCECCCYYYRWRFLFVWFDQFDQKTLI